MKYFEKITKLLLIIAGFLLVLQLITRGIDVDFGWHLRFGLDAFAGNFQYTDSYTYSFFGQSWVNHEWLSDIFFWLIYSTLGYFPLAVILSILVLSSFLLIQRIFAGGLSLSSLLIAILGIWSLNFVFAVRPLFLALIFIPLLILTLISLPEKKYLWTWPFLFWLWSALHGSWFVGFIIIVIYLGGNLGSIFLRNKYPKFCGKVNAWNLNIYLQILFWTAISALAITANPYGQKIWLEIYGYIFGTAYFKSIISEWIPSYAYPVYSLPLIIGAFATVLICLGYYKKRVSLSELLIFFAFFFSAWSYKRNNLYLVMLSLPILTIAVQLAGNKIMMITKRHKSFIVKTCTAVTALTAIIITVNVLPNITYSHDIWADRRLSLRMSYPYSGVEFIKNLSKNEKIILFNEFRWGGYLNWMLPEAKIFLDGRGTVTWQTNENLSLLEEYRKIKYEINGLDTIESMPVNYIMLNRNASIYPKPNLINRIIFSNRDLSLIALEDESQLEKMLLKSTNWSLIYEDNICRVWKKIN